MKEHRRVKCWSVDDLPGEGVAVEGADAISVDFEALLGRITVHALQILSGKMPPCGPSIPKCSEQMVDLRPTFFIKYEAILTWFMPQGMRDGLAQLDRIERHDLRMGRIAATVGHTDGTSARIQK
jgi:hypothetical protein